jgi:alkylated DNA repair dioxygenase AlkB
VQHALSFVEPCPPGFSYRDDVIAAGEERELLDHIGAIEFSAFEMRGVVARRRVAFFGLAYSEPERTPPPIPPFLEPLRARLAEWAAVRADDFAMALINEYRPGAPIGWHRDAPQYGIVAGVSLGSFCRMKFRPYLSPRDLAVSEDVPPRPHRKTTHEVTLAPRSGYLMTGAARAAYEHSIPAVHALRYSITFRTLRR